MRKTITLFVLIMLVACSPRPPEDGIIARAQYDTAMKSGEKYTLAVTIANHGKHVQRLEHVDVSNALYRELRLWPRDPRFRNEMFEVENCISFAFHDISVLPDETEELLFTCTPHMQFDVEGIIDVVIVYSMKYHTIPIRVAVK